MSINKSFWLLLIFILSGLVVGGLLGELATTVKGLGFLAYGQEFGITEPFVMDVGILRLTLGFIIRINIASIIGLLLSVFVYRVVVH